MHFPPNYTFSLLGRIISLATYSLTLSTLSFLFYEKRSFTPVQSDKQVTVTFINQLMRSIITVVDVKIYVV
jgi:hypothetical protein